MRWIVLAALAAAAPAPAPPITDLRPITLHPGVNHVPGFLPGGGTATIVEAWRGNGNAHGFHVWMVLGGASEGQPVGLVTIEGAQASGVTVSDNPFDGERVLGSVRFATARVEGRPVSLLIIADLDADDRPLADHDLATVRWFRLDHDEDAIGRATDVFVPFGEAHSTRRDCNADLAMRDLARVPLPPRYAGPNRGDGCFPNGG